PQAPLLGDARVKRRDDGLHGASLVAGRCAPTTRARGSGTGARAGRAHRSADHRAGHRAGDLPLTPAARSRSGGRTTAARRGAQPWSWRDGQETSSRAAAVYALVTSRVKSACAAATVATQSTLVASAAFS